MYQFQNLEDTIVAISTAVGQGGIGIIRLSGKNALAICDAMFVSRNKVKPTCFKSHTVHYGWVVNRHKDSEIIDEALLTVMRAPRSYTKEDVVEISCHGGIIPLREILNCAV